LKNTTTSDKGDPTTTCLELQNPTAQHSSIWVDLSISAWYPTDSVFKDSPNSTSPASTGVNSLPFARLAHEANYTISVVPSTTIGLQHSRPSEGIESTTNVLKESIFHSLDFGIIALTKDGKTEVRNQAFDKILSLSSGFVQRVAPISENDEKNSTGIVEAVEETTTVWDGNFEAPLELKEWPIFKCAFLGQTVPPVCLGLESKATGARSYVELVAKPIRDKAGYGEHIGGVVSLRDITTEREKRRLEAELQGDFHFKQIVDLMPQLIWTASGTGYVDWYSKSFLQYTGWAVIVQEDDLANISQKWSTAVRNGTRFETAVRIRKHDGDERWYLSRGSPMKDAETGNVVRWFGTCTDIHDQVEALSASRETQIQLQSVVKHAAVTLWAVDQEGIITMAEGPGIRDFSSLKEPAVDFTTLLAASAEDQQQTSKENTRGRKGIVGQSIYKIWGLGEICDSVNKAKEGETIVGEVEIRGIWYRSSCTPLRAQLKDSFYKYGSLDSKDMEVDTSEGAIVGVVIALMDITDRKEAQKRMEETLLEKTRALSAEEAAREASRLKSEFLANMSHEIRTPIAGIIGLTELMLDEEGLSSAESDYAQTIQRSAEGLLTVINDVLDFSKVEVGKLELEEVPFNLVVLLRDLKRMLLFTTQRKGLDFQIVHDIDSNEQFLGDLGRLRQVMTNLLTNAIKFTNQGQITLKVSHLPGAAEDDTLKIRFDIIDTGCGIHSRILARLFRPFSQADASTARRFGGTGLGLSISKSLVELMKGQIGLDSVEGRGSHAWFIVPFRKMMTTQDDHQMNELNGSDKSSTPPYSVDHLSDTNTGGIAVMVPTRLNRPRKDIWVLIAEDNLVNAQIASKNVEKMGFSCQIAANGNIALEELNKRDYDVVSMDCQMPYCDGYEATKMIRKSLNDDIRSLPVIALTASAIKGDRERAIDAGMVDYLAKPVKRPALESALCKWLFDHQARQTLARFLTVDPGELKSVSKRNREPTS